MKYILFVDDEPEMLASLKVMLRPHHREWHMQFVDSGAAALAELDRQPYDLICSDMRMQGMDGAQLLTQVTERWPGIVRIVLSGYTELTQTMRLVPLAHQYLSKPCDPKQFENTLARCLNVQDVLNRPGLRSLVGQIRQLPALPKTYARLREAMSKTNVSNSSIAAIVASDTAIAARVLQVVNSSFFRLAKQITKVEQAVAYLGFGAISNLVLSAEVFARYKNLKKSTGFDPERIQSEALKTTAAIRVLTQGTALSDDAITAGLLHDIGHLILLEVCPQKLQAAYAQAVASGRPLSEVESELIGASHAEVGAYLLALWGLPYSIVDAVAHHHDLVGISHTEFDLLGALTIAEALIDDASRATPTVHRRLTESDLSALHAPFNLQQAIERVTAVLAREASP